MVHRRFWRGGLVVSFGTPLLYLAAMGVGLGSVVERAGDSDRLGGLTYLEFVGPGLLAAAAMQVAAGESMWPIMGGLKWWRTWHAMLAGPIGFRDVVDGQFLYTAVRLLPGAVAYFGALLAFGVVDGPIAVLAIPAAVLTGMAFATPIAAFSATQENDQGFMIIFRLGVIPLFLFSGTFFPIEQLPETLETIAVWTPLWHGVDLVRGLVVGGLERVQVAAHLAYLTAWTAGGWALSYVTFRRRLVT